MTDKKTETNPKLDFTQDVKVITDWFDENNLRVKSKMLFNLFSRHNIDDAVFWSIVYAYLEAGIIKAAADSEYGRKKVELTRDAIKRKHLPFILMDELRK